MLSIGYFAILILSVGLVAYCSLMYSTCAMCRTKRPLILPIFVGMSWALFSLQSLGRMYMNELPLVDHIVVIALIGITLICIYNLLTFYSRTRKHEIK